MKDDLPVDEMQNIDWDALTEVQGVDLGDALADLNDVIEVETRAVQLLKHRVGTLFATVVVGFVAMFLSSMIGLFLGLVLAMATLMAFSWYAVWSARRGTARQVALFREHVRDLPSLR